MQDPMVFSLLEVMSLLCNAHMVPSDAWEFILCAIVTNTHVRCSSGICTCSLHVYLLFCCCCCCCCV